MKVFKALAAGYLLVGCVTAPNLGDGEQPLSENGSGDSGGLRELTGGSDANPDDFPSTMRIHGNCTAAKVAPNKILTAAHCVWDSKKKAFKQIFTSGKIEVTSKPAYTYDLSTDPRTGFVEVAITGIYIHPSWRDASNSVTKYYDVADVALIVVTDASAPAMAAIPIVPIDFAAVKPKDAIAIMGYGCENGLDDKSQFQPHLKYVRTAAIEDSAAINKDTISGLDAAKVGVHYFFTPGVEKDKEAASLCPGDSGGPVYRLGANEKAAQVVGVNAFYDFLTAPKEPGKSYSNWHTRLGNTWVEAALQDKAEPGIFVPSDPATAP